MKNYNVYLADKDIQFQSVNDPSVKVVKTNP